MNSELEYPAAFLVALGRLLELCANPEPEQEAKGAAGTDLMAALTSLLRQNTFPTFLFHDGEVEYEGEILSELRGWQWSLQLPEGGVERLDITPGTTREDLEGFVDEVVARLYLRDDAASVREVHGQTGIQFGELDIIDETSDDLSFAVPLSFDLDVEAEAVAWLNSEVSEHGVVPANEAATVVSLLSVAMHSERDVVVPLVQLKSVDQYTTTHSINVSCLSMALAEHLDYCSTDVRTIGEAALLHDVGKTKIPLEVLNKKGKLTESEWELIQQHTVEGARILLASGPGMELPAIVAYEHHLSFDGKGYPEFTFPRQTHPISRLIQVCDVYDALRTRRPFRPPWPATRTMKFLEEKAGTHLDPEFVSAFTRLITRWEPRRVDLESEQTEAAA
ncbi:MAG: HD domain-containing phosphohydrolase [Gemmatimonadota bacterium]|jgi:putative nucleotidyltransferase with HDIG domain